MGENTAQAIAARDVGTAEVGTSRRKLFGLATATLGGLIAAIPAVPGVVYLLSPLRRKGPAGALYPLARLSLLQVGVPRLFVIAGDRKDAWVKYPREPVGSVWLVRQPAGSDPPVLAMQSECPHLGCAINLNADRSGFVCPCHTSAFTLEGTPTNQVPPRPMDRLDVELTSGEDPEIRVRFRRFQPQRTEGIPLG